MRRIASADLAPPGSLIHSLEAVPGAEEKFTVRLPDGSGWHVCGEGDGLYLNDSGWGWNWNLDLAHEGGAYDVLIEGLSHDECMRIAAMTADEVRAEYVAPPVPAAPEWIIGVAVIVTHGTKCPRTLYCQRLAGALDGVGAWSIPGGRLDATDANIIACARREVLEETGLAVVAAKVLPGHKIGRVVASAKGQRLNGTPYVTLFVHATVASPQAEVDADGSPEACPTAQNTEPEKHGPWVWLSASELLELEGDVWDREIVHETLRWLT